MSAHAIVSASGAYRWLKCPPSARLELEFPQSSSIYAEEGTAAHALAEAKLRAYISDNPADLGAAEEKTRTSSPEMIIAVQDYCDLCIEKINAARAATPDAKILLEQRLDFSDWVPNGFGTGDLVIVSDGLLEIVDYKHGKGVSVSAVDNPQMRLYALGAISNYGQLYGFDSVSATIVQPRLDSVSTETLKVQELLEWGEAIRPIARQAFHGEGSYTSGSHCQFCRAKVKCRARAAENLELIKLDFKKADLMGEDELAGVLGVAGRLQAWAADLQKYALAQAMENGKQWPGYKLIVGKGKRTYSDADKVAERLIGAGYPEAILFERSLLCITKMEKTVGKKKFEELLEDLIFTPPGKPALVPENHKGRAQSSNEQTAKDFEEETK